MTMEVTVGDRLTILSIAGRRWISWNDDEGKGAIINVGIDSDQFYARQSDGCISGVPGPVWGLSVEIPRGMYRPGG